MSTGVLAFALRLVRPYSTWLLLVRTTFVIAHHLAIIRKADFILVLDQGRIVERGTHDDLRARNGLYARLDQSQGSTGEPPSLAT